MFISLLRMKQYTKNVFLFIPAIFAGTISVNILENLFFSFIFFSLAASSIYIINDIVDVNEDRLHPKKSKRVIASGKLSIKTAKLLALTLSLSSVAGLFAMDVKAGLLVSVYIAMNILYTFVLKHMAIYDVITIASGFIIRILIGGVIAGVYVSPWLAAITFSSTLFLAVAKRRNDVISHKNGITTRKVAAIYTEGMIDSIMVATASMTIVSYIIYSVEKSSIGHPVYLSSFFVIIGILKYIEMSFTKECGDDPTTDAIKNKHILILLVLWAITISSTIFWEIKL